MANVYIVVDTQADEEKGKCFIYCRDHMGKRKVFDVPATFRIVIGSKGNSEMLVEAISTIKDKYSDKVIIGTPSLSRTMYRGEKYLVSMVCIDFQTYNRVNNFIKHNCKNLFLCNSHETVEDNTLKANNIYTTNYVKYVNEKLVPAKESEHFYYVPKVGSFDFEMMSLDVVKKDSAPYMASYYYDNCNYLIYSEKYFDKNIDNSDNCKYIKVDDEVEVVSTLMRLIVATRPDRLLGYNIQYADTPILYYTLCRALRKVDVKPYEPAPYYSLTRKLEKKFVNSEHGVVIKIPGMSLVDMYVYLSDMLVDDDKDPMLSLDDVSSKFLGHKKDPITYPEMVRIYKMGTYEEKRSVMHYCCKDSKLVYELYDYFNVWNFHMSMTSISGIEPQRLISKGSVETAYGACSIQARRMGIYMDAPNKKIHRPTGGKVLDARRGKYANVHILDFNSLYPSICNQHNICHTTVTEIGNIECTNYSGIIEGKGYYGTTSEGDVLADNIGKLYLFKKETKGVLPSILSELLQRRQQLKNELASARLRNDEIEVRKLQGAESAVKKAANSACGALGEQTPNNPIAYCTLNDIITTTGRSILESSCEVATSLGANIVYGDTDSMMITYQGNIQDIIDAIHDTLPSGIRIKLEYIAKDIIISKKKHYIINTGKNIKIVGYKAVKPSRCKMVREIFKLLVDKIFEVGNEPILQMYHNIVNNLKNESNIDAKMYSYKFSCKGKEYSKTCHQAYVISALKSRGVEVIPGNHLEVTLVFSHDQYIKEYGCEPPIALPKNYIKAEMIYTLEEIGENVDVIDIAEVVKSQCYSNLSDILQSCSTNTTKYEIC